jgi:hypothetical protein
MTTAQRLRDLALLVLLVLTGPACAAPLYDAVADFSTTQNPNGVWTYGSGSGSAFTPFTQTLPSAWVGHDIPAATAQQFNTTSASITLDTGRLRLLPTVAGLPNNLTQDATVRWTAPAAGSYSIIAHLESLAGAGGTSPVVTLYQNNTSLETAALSSGFPLDFNRTLTFNTGDTLDFKNPANIPQSELNVFLTASVQQSTAQNIPLPAALYAFFPSAGVAAYFHRRWRRRT